MSKDTDVVYFDSVHPGMPVVSGNPGSLATMLETLLASPGVNAAQSTRFRVCVPPTSGGITGLGNDATVEISFASTPAFAKGQVVEMMPGATGWAAGSIGRRWRVIDIIGNVVTAQTTHPGWWHPNPDSTEGEAVQPTFRLPGAGWAVKFSGTSKTVLQGRYDGFLDAGQLYRIDDTGARSARIRGYEAMSDVDTGSGPFPTDAQLSGGGYISRSSTTDATARRWIVVADSELAIVMIAANASLPVTPNWLVIGRPLDAMGSDLFCGTVIASGAENYTNGSPGANSPVISRGSNVNQWTCRGKSQVGASVASSRWHAPGGSFSSDSGSAVMAPLADFAGAAPIWQLHVADDSNASRARLPIYGCGAYLGSDSGYPELGFVTAGADQYLCVPSGSGATMAARGHIFVKLSGPWR